ncbi:GNAT family N-acetyltransferase [Brevibacillus fulvus]|uniref:N-acetyltransferase domain-containing protein n=1 Tax=Brevibacillus fulvus TaxID=1125967 RepID=A0A938Y0M6_9BACL|nr:GNAT family N-acetyltransferase [Brevibacillus fulvus]MBM7591013.1 hypothetical protein [Brevibacillus fulvus]
MYKRVDSKELLDTFHRIKEEVWNEMGFEMEYAKKGSDLFLLLGEDGQPGGTIEFTPISQSTDFIKNVFLDVLEEGLHYFEGDSLAVLPKYRGKLGRMAVCLMVDYAEKHGFTHMIGIADPAFYQQLINKYKLHVKQVKEAFFYKGADVIPVVIDIKEVFENKHHPRFSWYIPQVEQKEGTLIG